MVVPSARTVATPCGNASTSVRESGSSVCRRAILALSSLSSTTTASTSPPCSARTRSSCLRMRRSSSDLSLMDGTSASRLQIEAHQHSVGVGEIADDFAHRDGEFAYERGDGHDLITPRDLRIGSDVDDLDGVAVVEVLGAELFQVGDGGDGFGGLSDDVKAQVPRIVVRRGSLFLFR